MTKPWEEHAETARGGISEDAPTDYRIKRSMAHALTSIALAYCEMLRREARESRDDT